MLRPLSPDQLVVRSGAFMHAGIRESTFSAKILSEKFIFGQGPVTTLEIKTGEHTGKVEVLTSELNDPQSKWYKVAISPDAEVSENFNLPKAIRALTDGQCFESSTDFYFRDGGTYENGRLLADFEVQVERKQSLELQNPHQYNEVIVKYKTPNKEGHLVVPANEIGNGSFLARLGKTMPDSFVLGIAMLKDARSRNVAV
jgi:hypothetical protein